MPKDYVKVGQEASELMAGLNTLFQPHHLPMGASPFVRNVDFSRKPGSIAKRRGQSIYNASLGAGFITGLHEFIDNSGVTTVFFSTSDGIIYNTPSTSRYSGTGTDPVEFATFTNLCIAVGVNIATLKSTGPAAFTPLLGIPPANGHYVIVYKNRLFIANTSAGNSRLHFSAASNAEDWTTVNSAGFIDVNKDDGDFITGLAVCGGYLFIFKQHSVHILSGTGPQDFVVSQTPVFEGTIAPRSLINMGTFLDFLSFRAVQSTAPGNYNGEQSVNIKPDIEGLTNTVKMAAVAGRRLYQYWLAFDSDGDGKNDAAYVIDYNTKAWSYYDNVKANVFKTFSDGTLISGGSDLQILRKHDITEDDVSTPINMRWRTKEFEVTSFTDLKTILNTFIRAVVLPGKTLTMNVFVDGNNQTDPIVFGLDAVVSGDSIVVAYVKGLSREQGHTIQFEFSNAEANAPVVLTGFDVEVNVDERQYTGPGPISAPSS